MKKQVSVFISLLFLTAGVAACGKIQEETPKESIGSRLQHTQKDDVSTIMGRKIANIDYIMYGFINFDAHKIKKGTDNLIEISKYLADKRPKRRLLSKQTWDDLRNKQMEISQQVAAAFNRKNYEQSREHFKELVANCMECHKLIKHQ